MASAFPLLWFTSRTPTDVGQRQCAMARYLGYHAGPHGTGYRRKALSVPLATGSAVHTGAELLAEWIMDFQDAHAGVPPAYLPREVIAWAAGEAAAGYEREARAKGFLEAQSSLDGVGEGGVDTITQQPAALPPPIEHLILEQRTLIEAQVWLFAIIYLPQMFASYRLIGSEVEESLVLDCTCGLGAVGGWEDHAARGCTGIVQMGRADYLWEGYTGDATGLIAYAEFKTKATQTASWEKAWEHSGQLLVNMECASRRLGKSVDHADIVVLFKGWRGRDKGDPPEAPKYQHSPLCYGWYDTSNLQGGNWASQYRWTDDYGKGHTLGRSYKRTPVWDPSIPLVVPDVPADATRVEQWLRGWIVPRMYPDLVKVLGPFPRPLQRVPLALQSIEAEEQRWRSDVGEIRRQVAQDVPEWQAADAIIPRSWNCTGYDTTPCAFQPVCFRDPGWEDPIGTGKFQIRTPHHASEQQAVEACGIQFPVEVGADADEEIDPA